jgi:hypothetical protein
MNLMLSQYVAMERVITMMEALFVQDN